MDGLKLLDWDSQFFGFQVAEITPTALNSDDLERILQEAREQNISLVYWRISSLDLPSIAAAESHHGFLADRKTTFKKMLDRPPAHATDPGGKLEKYEDINVTEQMEDLAIQSGCHSRFNVDPMIPRGKFEELYRHWIRNSVSGSFADAVFVIRESDDQIVGIITCSCNNNKVKIGILAVDHRYRRKGYGQLLINAADRYARDKGCSFSEVATQKENFAAAHLYEKCGYSVVSQENFYHFWINPAP